MPKLPAIFGILLISLIPSLAAAKAKVPNYLITSNSIGAAKLGMSLDELKKFLPSSEYAYRPEGVVVEKRGCVIYSKKSQRELLTLVLLNAKGPNCNGVIAAIATANSLFKTSEGVRVGSLISYAERKYGAALLRYNREEDKEYLTFRNAPHIDFHSFSFPAGIYQDPYCIYCQSTRYQKDAKIDLIEIYM